ncbi:MAG: RluA family pseudouridine synthase [Bacteroidota bacterium]
MSDETENKNPASLNDDLYEHHRIIVDPGQSLLRIDKFLVDRVERVTRNKVQNAIRAGAVLVNDKQIKPNYKIKPNDVITIVLPTVPKEKGVIPEDIPLDIRYEDDDLIVLHKPAGMVVHPGVGNHSGTLVNALAHHFKSLPVMKGNQPDRPGLVHRIDKDTSGLMVVAKSEYAMTHLAKQFFDHTIERKYVALVWGEPDIPEGTYTDNIGRHKRHRLEMATYPEGGEEGKVAITHYRLLEGLYYVSLVECELETGRTHQIRVHMKYNGHPLFNDERYGGDKIVKGTVYTKYRQFVENCFKLLPRQGLHAKSLGFVHPAIGKEMFFESDLPEDMSAALDKWRKYVAGRKDL